MLYRRLIIMLSWLSFWILVFSNLIMFKFCFQSNYILIPSSLFPISFSFLWCYYTTIIFLLYVPWYLYYLWVTHFFFIIPILCLLSLLYYLLWIIPHYPLSSSSYLFSYPSSLLSPLLYFYLFPSTLSLLFLLIFYFLTIVLLHSFLFFQLTFN